MTDIVCKMETCIWNAGVCLKDTITISSEFGGDAGCEDFEETDR